MKHLKIFLIITSFVLMNYEFVFAQAQAQAKTLSQLSAKEKSALAKQRMAATRKACGIELLKFCRKEKKDVASARICLTNNVSKLKGTCRAHVDAYTKDYIHIFGELCGDSAKKFCPDKEMKEAMSCLKLQKEIPADCKALLP